MKDISNKPLSWTGTHPLERLYLDVKARAERAEAEAAAYRARLDAAELAAHEWREKYAAAFENYRNTEYWLADLQRAHEISEELVDQLRAQLDAARAELAALRKRINIVMNQAAIQCDDGNWNYSDYMRGLANGLLLAKSDLDNSPYLPLARPERWLEEVAGRQWRPNDDQALFEDKDIEGEIILTATFQQRNHCWNVDGISILPSGVVAWRPLPAAPGDGGEEE